jgi:hypothetical protein
LACTAVGVEPTLTTGQGRPAARSRFDIGDLVTAVGLAGMSQHAAQIDVRGAVERLADLDQILEIRPQPGAPVAGVELDQHLEARAKLGRARADAARHVEVVRDNSDPGARGLKARHPSQLVERDSDPVDHVGKAVLGEILGFLERGDRDATGMARGCEPADFGGLGGLHVRSQVDAQAARARAHARDIGLQTAPVEDQGRGIQFGQLHGFFFLPTVTRLGFFLAPGRAPGGECARPSP